jgi:ATP-dependent helicase/DNAse subunit B
LQREQAGLFYQAVTRTDQHLLITRPYLSDDGEKWEESPFWKAVQRLFDASVIETVRPDDPQSLTEAASSQELLFSAVRRRSLPQKYELLNGRWSILRHARDVLKARRSKHASGPHEGYVGPVADALGIRYSPTQTWSASKLENYGSCPYQFFVSVALGLEPPVLPKLGLDPSQLGSILHKILEETYKNLPDPRDLQTVLASLKTTAGRVFSSAPKLYGFRPSPLWNYEKAQLFDKLQKTICAMAEDSAWTPFKYELAFGIKESPPLEINLGDETIRIRGVIDRVDQNSSGQLRVVDYKTGSSHLADRDLKEGRRLQLPIYALAVRDLLKCGTPLDGFYWKILSAEAGSLKLAKFKTDTAQGVDAAVEVLCEHLVRIVKGVRSAEFPPDPARAGCPFYCPAAQWCWHFELEW